MINGSKDFDFKEKNGEREKWMNRKLENIISLTLWATYSKITFWKKKKNFDLINGWNQILANLP